MAEAKRFTARQASSYIAESAAAVALCYFVFGGSSWSPTVWAIFSVVAVAIAVIQVLFDAGNQSEVEHSSWKLRLGFVMVTALLVTGLWKQSWWLLGLGSLLGWFWLGDWQAHSQLVQRRIRAQPEHDISSKSLELTTGSNERMF